MAYKQKSGLQFKGLFDNLKRAVTAKKVITQDLENKSHPFVEGTRSQDVRVYPREGSGYWSMPKEDYIKQASKVYRKTGLKPTEGTREILGGKTSHFRLPESDNINVEVGERTINPFAGSLPGSTYKDMKIASGREITMTATKDKSKKSKVKTPKVKTPKTRKVKTPDAKYNISKRKKGYQEIRKK